MEYILTIVKFTSLIVAAAFAIWGTTIDFKKKSKMAKKGRIAIITVIATSLISATAIGLEENDKHNKKVEADETKKLADEKSQAEKKELYEKFEKLFENTQKNIRKTDETLGRTNEVAKGVERSFESQKDIAKGVQQNLESQDQLLTQSKEIVERQDNTFRKTQDIQTEQEQVLQNTSRVLLPISQLAMSYTLKFSLDNPVFEAYRKRVQDFIGLEDTEIMSNEHLFHAYKDDVTGEAVITVYQGSDLLPSFEKEKEIDAAVLLKNAMEISFYKDMSMQEYEKKNFPLSDLR